MITFKTINNQLYRIFDEPKIINPDKIILPALCALTSFGEEGKCNIVTMKEQRLDPENLVVLTSINMDETSNLYSYADGYEVLSNIKGIDTFLQYYKFEVIGDIVEIGSPAWGLHNMMMGRQIRVIEDKSIIFYLPQFTNIVVFRHKNVDYCHKRVWEWLQPKGNLYELCE